MRILSFLLILCCCLACNNTAQNPTPTTNPKTKVTTETTANPATSQKKKTIIFFGDSLTAAYKLKPEEGFTHLIQQRIDSLGMDYKVVNAGNSGETTAGGVGRINWVLKQPIDVFVLELGGNDALRGIDPETTYNNLSEIAQRVRSKYPQAKLVIAGMEAPPNLGKAFTDAFRGVFQRIAKENQASLIPFLLENVGGIPELNLPDGIHPTPKGHQIVAENIWTVLKDVL